MEVYIVVDYWGTVMSIFSSEKEAKKYCEVTDPDLDLELKIQWWKVKDKYDEEV